MTGVHRRPVRRAANRPRRGTGGDTGSLPLALLLTLIGVTLSALLVPVVVAQITAGRRVATRDQSLDAAQAGLEAATGRIRAAADGTGTGDFTLLPCGTLTGRVSASGGARYEVTISYVDASGTAVGCTADAVPHPQRLPATARLVSRGTDRPDGAIGTVPGRTLTAGYQLRTSAEVITGGLIHAYRGGTGVDLCLAAGSGTPTAGSAVTLRTCDGTAAAQKFRYLTNLTISLVASRSASSPLGMCLDAGTPHAAGAVVVFRDCASYTRPQQQWIFNDSGNFEGVADTGAADGGAADGYCLNAQLPGTAGSGVILGSVAQSRCRQGYDTRSTFVPDPTVGTGAAGAWTGQLVDFGEYARCAAVTNADPGYAYLVAEPCRQATDPAALGWTQRWTLPATGAPGRIRVTAPGTPGTDYCLQSPGSTLAGRYVTLVACPATGATPTALSWTLAGSAGTYGESYRVTDGFGYCLAPTDPAAVPPDLHPVGQQVSKLVVTTCDSAPLRKWNVPPNTLGSPPLSDIAEQ